MRVRVILSPQNARGIIGKMAKKLTSEVARAGADATLAAEPDADADINHWMSYAFVGNRAGRASTVAITHIDDPYKALQVKNMLETRVDLGVCMSRDMMRALISWGVPVDRLLYILPALDRQPDPARIRIATATMIYADGRKRENLLVRLAAEFDLSPFHFEIAGVGWDAVIPKLREAGASVNWNVPVNWNAPDAVYDSEHRAILDAMRSCEYYLYLGMDEGSMGTLDALALGLKTIITPQGFHLDLQGGITEPVETYEQFAEAMQRLAGERARRLASVANWTWEEYARDHLLVWNALLEGKRAEAGELLYREARYVSLGVIPPASGLSRRTWSGFYARLLSPRRMFGAVARMPWLYSMRLALFRLLRRMLFRR